MKTDIARRTDVQIFFDGVDISSEISKYLLSVTYTDCEESEADDLQIKLADRDNIWLCKWLEQAIRAAAGNAAQRSNSNAGSVYTVNAKAGLNVRSGAGMGCSKLGALAFGTTVYVKSITNEWAAIDYNGSTAYAYAQYLTAEGIPNNGVSSASGFQIRAAFSMNHGNGMSEVLDCGQFELDSVSADGPPSIITMKATALPYTSAVRQTKKTQAWEAYTLRGIAEEIARRNGMACLFDVEINPYYDRSEQYQQSDIAFLQKLCLDAGISLKATSNMLVLFDQAIYDKKDAVLTIQRGDKSYEKYKLKVGKADAEYSSCRVSYTKPDGSVISAIAYSEDYEAGKQTNQQLEITAKVNSIAEAQTLAEKRLRLHNKYERSASFTLSGMPSALAGNTVLLVGWGYWDGKYVIKKAKHSVSGSYTTTVELRRAMEG